MLVHDGRPGEGVSRLFNGVSVMGGPALPPPVLMVEYLINSTLIKTPLKTCFASELSCKPASMRV